MKNWFDWKMIFVSSMAFFYMTSSTTTIECPNDWKSNRTLADLVLLAEAVSYPNGSVVIHGQHSNYTMIHQADGLYDTRMRWYTDTEHSVYVVFRPIQETWSGMQIHLNRKLVPCTLSKGCVGHVHQRFQLAFLDMIQTIPSLLWSRLQEAPFIYTTGHSLGGSLARFFSVYSFLHSFPTPSVAILFGAPFIADETFEKTYLSKDDGIWDVFTINAENPLETDTIMENYNVPLPPFIYIEDDQVCSMTVVKRWDTFTIHDLRNYQTWFDE